MKDGWTKTTLGDITEAYEKADPRKQKEDDFRYIDIGCIDNQRHEIVEAKEFKGKDAPSRARRVVRTGDVLFSTVRPYLKNITRVPEEYDGDLTSTGITILRASPAVESDFLFYTVVRDEYIKEISGEMDGTLYPAVRDKDVYSSEIPLPPLNEQRRIVAKIEELTARSRSAKQALDAIPPLLERFRQSVLAAAFRGDLTKQWRQQNPNTEPASELLNRIRQERRHRWEQDYLQTQKAKGKQPKNDKWKAKYKEPEPLDTRRLPALPTGWCWAKMDELTTKVVDGTHHRPQYTDTGIPFISVKNVRNDTILFDDTKFVSFETHEKLIKRCHPEPGDILVTKSGATIGRVAVIKTDQPFSLFVSVALLKLASQELNSDWMALAFKSWFSSININKDIKGSAIKNLHLEDFREIPIALMPTGEQEQLVSELESLIGRVAPVQREVDQLATRIPRLNQSILAKAFRGELVPQSPTDEPAPALLKRIRAEREAAQPMKSRKKARK